jgi:hypothetical protein
LILVAFPRVAQIRCLSGPPSGKTLCCDLVCLTANLDTSRSSLRKPSRMILLTCLSPRDNPKDSFPVGDSLGQLQEPVAVNA